MFMFPSWAKTIITYVVILFVGFGFGVLYHKNLVSTDQITTLTKEVKEAPKKQAAIDSVASNSDASAAIAETKIVYKDRYITKEVTVYEKTNPDASSPIGSEWVRLHDLAATNPSDITRAAGEPVSTTASAAQ